MGVTRCSTGRIGGMTTTWWAVAKNEDLRGTWESESAWEKFCYRKHLAAHPLTAGGRVGVRVEGREPRHDPDVAAVL